MKYVSFTAACASALLAGMFAVKGYGLSAVAFLAAYFAFIYILTKGDGKCYAANSRPGWPSLSLLQRAIRRLPMRVDSLRNLKGGEYFIFPSEEKQRPVFEDEVPVDQSAVFLMVRAEGLNPGEHCFTLINGDRAGTEWVTDFYNDSVIIVVEVAVNIRTTN